MAQRAVVGGDRLLGGHRGGLDRRQGHAGPADARPPRTDSRYGFDRHKGYATAEHLAAVAELGYSEAHRRSFKPASLFDTLD